MQAACSGSKPNLPYSNCLLITTGRLQVIVLPSLCCRAHVGHEFGKLRSSNTVSIRVKSVGDWWEADPDSKLFRLAEKALAQEWNVQPLLVREGGTMPVSHRPSSLSAG